MTREELAVSIDEVIDRLKELGRPGLTPPDEDAYWAGVLEYLPAAYPQGRHGQALLEGDTDTRPIAVPPHASGDLLASLRVALAEDGAAGRVQLVAVVPSGPGAICVRFETPERMNYPDEDAAEGAHDFHHSQQSSSVRGGEMPSTESLPTWYPDSKIAIPLPAQDSLDLLLCALLSIRHPAFLRELATTLTATLNERVSRLLDLCGAQSI